MNRQDRSKLPFPEAGDPMRARDFCAVSSALESLRSYNGTQAVPPLDFICVLDEDLGAPENSKKPTSAKATVLQWDYEVERYMEAADYIPEEEDVPPEDILKNQITVWNFAEGKSYDVDTFGYAKWREPHLWFHGDCDAMASRRSADPEE